MSRPRRVKRRLKRVDRGAARTFWIVTGIIVFLLADVVLVAIAVAGTRSEPSTVPVDAPTFLTPTVPRTSSPTPTSTATPLSTVPASFLMVLNATTGWRATAGNCGSVDSVSAPVIESTDDAGVTWLVHSPGTLDARQVLNLSANTEGDATVVAKTGQQCAIENLGTFSSGAYWDSYPTRLADQNFIDTTSPSTLHLQGTTVEAPCATALQLDVVAGQPWVLCPDALFTQASTGEWSSLNTPGAGAFTMTASGALLALRDVTGCAGINISALSLPLSAATLTSLSCATTQSPSGAIALDAAGDSLWLIADGVTSVSADGGSSW